MGLALSVGKLKCTHQCVHICWTIKVKVSQCCLNVHTEVREKFQLRYRYFGFCSGTSIFSTVLQEDQRMEVLRCSSFFLFLSLSCLRYIRRLSLQVYLIIEDDKMWGLGLSKPSEWSIDTAT